MIRLYNVILVWNITFRFKSNLYIKGRTFPAHTYFKESGEAGQEALYRVCKAYSLYDAEVGYCQGQSFLGISLLFYLYEEKVLNI